MALLAGGGYAEQVVVDAGLGDARARAAARDEEAAAFPEVFLTAFLNIFQLGELADGGPRWCTAAAAASARRRSRSSAPPASARW